VNLYLPPSVSEALRAEAEARDVSMSRLVVEAVRPVLGLLRAETDSPAPREGGAS
jgi:hypothetical protein